MAHQYVLCKHMQVKRKASDGSRLPLDRFSSSYSDPSAIAALLRKRGHTLVEFLNEMALLSKLYFDADRDIGKSEPTPGSIDAFHREVIARMEQYMTIVRPYVPDVSYVVAQRHGYCPKKKGYKLSFRTFVNGIAIHHGDCPDFIKALDPEVGFWDMSVYTRSEQLICAINGKKGKGDERVLVPLDPSHLDDERILQYVVQHVEPGWFHINTADDDDDDDSVTVDCDGVDDSIVRLVRCLGRTTSDNRADWIRVGMILKGLGGDCYYPAWLEFSRIGDKFHSDNDCEKTWRSLVAVEASVGAAAGRLTIGTLRYFAKRDDPAAYQVWRATSTYAPQAQTPAPSWDTCHVVRAAAGVIRSDGEVGVDARVEGGDVLFCSDENEYRVRLSTLGVTSVSDNNPMYIHGTAPGVACSNIVIPNTVAPSQGWNMTRPTQHNVHLKSDGPPRTELLLDMNGDAVIRATVNYPDSNKKVLLRNTKALLAMLNAKCTEAIREHLQSQLMVPANIVNNIVFAVNNGTINNYGGGEDAADSSEFELVRDVLLAHAKDRGHRKAAGLVYEVVDGCPCAFHAIGTIEEYISRVLKRDVTFMRHPRRFDELVKFLSNYKDLDELPELQPQRDLLSFANGVLRLDDGAFFPYDAFDEGHPLCGMAARHHIAAPYDPDNTATPLLDRVLDAQFDRQVADLLIALLGRLLFPVGARDSWQVMPYLVGLGGTGKSLILAVVSMLFRKGSVGNLGSKREEVFGMANLVDKEVVIGRDMPAKLSGALSQELMQVMVAGESMEIPRKGLTALNVDWTAPVIMGSNHMPDYVNTGDNIGRRIVTFRFDRVIAHKDEELLNRIKEIELPAIVCRALGAYREVVERARVAGGFWKAVPPKILEWRGVLAAATSKLHEFLSMDEDERGFAIQRVEGHVTWVHDFKDAYQLTMGEKLDAVDGAVMSEFGFTVSDKIEHVCKACKQIARGGRNRCCMEYDTTYRTKKFVIYNLHIA